MEQKEADEQERALEEEKANERGSALKGYSEAMRTVFANCSIKGI